MPLPNSLETVLPLWQEQLQAWAADGSLASAARHALELEGEKPLLDELVAKWASGDFSALPPITLLPASSMPGAAGAYAISTETIYLNKDWLETASDEQVVAVLTEELGHHLDALLNEVDTPGDEGQVFSLVIDNLDKEIQSNYGTYDKVIIHDPSSEDSLIPAEASLRKRLSITAKYFYGNGDWYKVEGTVGPNKRGDISLTYFPGQGQRIYAWSDPYDSFTSPTNQTGNHGYYEILHAIETEHKTGLKVEEYYSKYADTLFTTNSKHYNSDGTGGKFNHCTRDTLLMDLVARMGTLEVRLASA